MMKGWKTFEILFKLKDHFCPTKKRYYTGIKVRMTHIQNGDLKKHNEFVQKCFRTVRNCCRISYLQFQFPFSKEKFDCHTLKLRTGIYFVV